MPVNPDASVHGAEILTTQADFTFYVQKYQ